MEMLSHEEKRDWLRLIRSENVGPATFFHLLKIFRSPTKALMALPLLSRNGSKRSESYIPSIIDAEKEMNDIEDFGAEIIIYKELTYPCLLTHIPDPPPVLIIKGDKNLLARCDRNQGISIVGARNCSINAKRLAELMAKELGKSGHVIISGLARGIDAASHKGSLETGTIAVIAGGINIVYPKENNDLYNKISELGLLISEDPFSLQPQSKYFPKRNRLIAGLSVGVLVVEAALHSGSLGTARYAIDYGREVFAIPGFPMDPRAKGTNSLIKQGATMVETAQDIIETLNLPHLAFVKEEHHEFEFEEVKTEDLFSKELMRARILIQESISYTPSPIDFFVSECKIPVSIISIVFLELELAGKIMRHPGNKVSLLLEPSYDTTPQN